MPSASASTSATGTCNGELCQVLLVAVTVVLQLYLGNWWEDNYVALILDR